MSDQHMTTARILALFPLAEVDRTNRLLADYLLNVPNACDLFAHDPEEMADVARRTQAQTDRPRLAAALAAFQQRLGADAMAVDNARLLADPTTPVITVGQQSGLLTGPLYTMYKAMTAINVAQRLQAELGRPVVPVFWAATDDDDRGEADHCGCWDQQYGLHALHYPETAGETGQLIGALPTACYGDTLLAQLEPLIDGLPNAEDVLALLRETLAASTDMGEWFCRLMSRLFAGTGLVLCDPRLPELRRLSAAILRRELEHPLDSTTLVNARARELQQRGYRPQLTKPADVCNLFLLDGQRQRITYHHGVFRAGGRDYLPEALLALLDAEPERFSPNAVLRPVVQEYLLSSAAFITGPNELGYWAELDPVFQSVQVAMPPVMPRAAATLVPSGVARFLHQWNLHPLQMLFDYDQVRFGLLQALQPEPVSDAFETGRTTIEQLVAHLTTVIANFDSTLAQSALATHQRLLNELERLERKTLRAVERTSGEQNSRLERARQTLFPRRGLQERTLNVFCLLARHGFTVLDDIRALLDTEEGRHLFIEV